MSRYLLKFLLLFLLISCGKEKIEVDNNTPSKECNSSKGKDDYTICYNGLRFETKHGVVAIRNGDDVSAKGIKNELEVVTPNYTVKIYNLPEKHGLRLLKTYGSKKKPSKEKGDLILEFFFHGNEMIVQKGTITTFKNNTIIFDAFVDDKALKGYIHWKKREGDK
ncbi:hypothetical protein K4L44_15360 [Halosquirtibacter laminarini]|uniref:Uncharacterized protein n=1 Tax=Halosquirtibacter laminarini TaxID=3374600 RepID=A0AC61NK85_9BACT|nr:hypothetical protein K4L44_15360 [Prolixibacteraceae bacterium]